MGYFMATQILKYNFEFVLHDARIYVFSVLHMNSGITFSCVLLLLLLNHLCAGC